MPEQKIIVPLKHLADLHRKSGFPLDAIVIKFKDSDWIVKFYSECFEILLKRGSIVYKGANLEKPGNKYPRGLSALSTFLSRKLGYKDLDLRDRVTHKYGANLLVVAFLIRLCYKGNDVAISQKFDELQQQIEEVYFGRSRKGHGVIQNFGAKTINIFYNSPKPLNVRDFAGKMQSEFGDRITIARAQGYFNSWLQMGYLVSFKPRHRLYAYYVLRGEENKFQPFLKEIEDE